MAFQNYDDFGGSSKTLEELDSYLLDPSSDLDSFIKSGVYNQVSHFSVQTNKNSAFEPSTLSFSSNGSSGSHPDCLSDSTNNDVYTNNPLPMTTSYGIDSLVEAGVAMPHSVEGESESSVVEIVGRRNLKEMLVACAKAIDDNDFTSSEFLMSELQSMVSVGGDPLQRLGAYMLEGLVARLASSGSSIYKALRCKEPTGPELLSYMHLLYEACPYFKFGYLSANGAIAEATKNENMIHIVDFQINQGTQWITLIQALATRPGGPPQVRITGLDDSFSSHARGGGLEVVGQRLSGLARSCGVPFEFQPVSIPSCEVESTHLGLRPGEALAVNFAMMLHHTPDETVGVQNHRDRLLRMVRSLSPRVVTLVEHESNTNTSPFVIRFAQTLEYYLAVFDSIDVALSRDYKERINVEQHCLARDIVNIVACEGLERVERHEPLGKWRRRFSMAGFSPYPLSSYVNATIKTLLENYSKNYRLQERDGCLFLGWMNRDLVTSCAWV